MMLYIVIGVVVLVALWAIMTFNGLVTRRAMVAEGWSGIDAQLKRRADLIPNRSRP
jgi:LemA protein